MIFESSAIEGLLAPMRKSLRMSACLLVCVAVLGLAQAQQSYWLGRPAGTEYVFDTRLPADFAAMITASGPEYAAFVNLPKLSTEVVDGTTYSFVRTEVSWDKDAIDNGSISFVRNGMLGAAWFHMDTSSAEWQALAQQVKNQATIASADGAWKRAELLVLVSADAAAPTVRVPIPETTLARTRMSELGEVTKSGLYYPSVQVPADLAAFREQMLAYGNAGRRDPDFRKNSSAQTAADLSGDTVSTLGGTNRVFKQSDTPPYFNDHVLNDNLNQAAQFQAEYQAFTNQMGHGGPRSFTDPNTGRSGDLSTLGKRAEFFGAVPNVVEAAGGNAPGSAPHSWMVSDTHFRPWFNVDGCYPEIGYGAARAADGTWYYAAVPVRDAECLNASATAAVTSPPTPPATPAAPAAPGGATPDAMQGTFPITSGTTLRRGAKYYSESGNHFLSLNPDGNLVVARADGGYVWGFDTQGVDYSRVDRVDMQADGNLVAHDANGGYVWSALTESPVPGSRLILTAEGALQLVSDARSVSWSTMGD